MPIFCRYVLKSKNLFFLARKYHRICKKKLLSHILAFKIFVHKCFPQVTRLNRALCSVKVLSLQLFQPNIMLLTIFFSYVQHLSNLLA